MLEPIPGQDNISEWRLKPALSLDVYTFTVRSHHVTLSCTVTAIDDFNKQIVIVLRFISDLPRVNIIGKS